MLFFNLFGKKLFSIYLEIFFEKLVVHIKQEMSVLDDNVSLYISSNQSIPSKNWTLGAYHKLSVNIVNRGIISLKFDVLSSSFAKIFSGDTAL